MPSPSLLDLVPPPAIYRRIPLDPRLNALGPWQKATEKFVTAGDGTDLREDLVYSTPTSAERIPPVHLEIAREVLRHNEEVLEALDQGRERGQLQFGELLSLEHLPAETDFVSRLGDVARLYLIRSRLEFSEGNPVAAAESLFRLEKIGAMICNGEGQILHYLIGLELRTAAVRGFGHLAANAQTPRAVLEHILETLDDGLGSPDGLAQSLRVDLSTIALARLDRLIDGSDLEKVVDRLLQVYYSPRRNPTARGRGPEYAAIADGWLEERRRQILRLLHDHPNPFDKTATARLMGVIVADVIRDLNHSRQPPFLDLVGQLRGMRRRLRLYRLARKTRFWPVELAPKVQIDPLPSAGAKPIGESEITTIHLPAENLTEARLAALKARLGGIDNPLGLMLAGQLMDRDSPQYLLDLLRKMKRMRGLIRLRLAAEGKGRG